jgi:uncharacterized protein YdaU (DUF1376 family)
MQKLPYMQFYPTDYLIDTEMLSLAAQGLWMRMLCHMWGNERRGIINLRITTLSRLVREGQDTVKSLLMEIKDLKVGDIEFADDGTVTITNRRIIRDWERAIERHNKWSESGKEGAEKRYRQKQLDNNNNLATLHENDGHPIATLSKNNGQAIATLSKNDIHPNGFNWGGHSIPEARSQKLEARSYNPETETEREGGAGGDSTVVPGGTAQNVETKINRFVPPTAAECRAYAIEIGMMETQALSFLDHFTSNGWKVSGRAPMRDWKAAMRNWNRRSETTPNRNRVNGQNHKPRFEDGSHDPTQCF